MDDSRQANEGSVADKAYAAATRFNARQFKAGTELDKANAAALGGNVLREDLGYFDEEVTSSDVSPTNESLILKLLSNTRADSSSCFGLVMRNNELLHAVLGWVKILSLGLTVSMALNAYLIFKVLAE